ncbi:MAG: c-type cytochrome [Gammaproteobacteria bacterium]|nr:c-type cytochrome [Gammaproteobacteria bacterium]
MSQEQDKIFFRNYSLVIGALAVMIVIFIIVARMFGIDEEADARKREALIAKRTAPVGDVSVVGEEPAPAAPATADAGAVDGKAVYEGLCVACHGVPGIGAPVTGNEEDWGPRIAKGKDTLYSNAINGYTGEQGYMMPARGGGNLSDEEVKAAVDYMVAESGGGDGGSADAAAGSGEAMAAAGKSGEEVYNAMCVACHGVPGIGAPVMGNKEDWAPRIAKGNDTLYSNAINGYTGESGFMMPARGGGNFTDEEVKAAVDFMVENSQ